MRLLGKILSMAQGIKENRNLFSKRSNIMQSKAIFNIWYAYSCVTFTLNRTIVLQNFQGQYPKQSLPMVPCRTNPGETGAFDLINVRLQGGGIQRTDGGGFM